ncbi:MAG: hypothetical protein DWQ19_09480 [Crenarchaeota archaeon]|nr:MAG: hypothetical protein DWQ19_09480 [Thermoproteota archaeon]
MSKSIEKCLEEICGQLHGRAKTGDWSDLPVDEDYPEIIKRLICNVNLTKHAVDRKKELDLLGNSYYWGRDLRSSTQNQKDNQS